MLYQIQLHEHEAALEIAELDQSKREEEVAEREVKVSHLTKSLNQCEEKLDNTFAALIARGVSCLCLFLVLFTLNRQ